MSKKINILLIPDKFKGSLTAKEVIEAIKKGIIEFNPSFNIQHVFASDGGEGFLDAIIENSKIEMINVRSVDPLGREFFGTYGLDNEMKTAYIELANCSGLALLSPQEMNVLKTSTFGTGLQLKNAIEKGVNKVYFGLGGSATNDGGIGIAAALGYRFLDYKKNDLDPIGKNLSLIFEIIKPQNKYKKVKIYAVNDVKNPLFGKNGAAQTYGKQKGADNDAIDLLDNGLRNLDDVVKHQMKINVAHVPGAGAAGGTAYGLKVFFDADFLMGTEFILQKNGALDKMKNHNIDLIITGEGKIDDQTAYGKLVNGVAVIGNRFNIPVIAICGKNELKNSGQKSLGLESIIEIGANSKPLEYNMENAAPLIHKAILTYFKKNY